MTDEQLIAGALVICRRMLHDYKRHARRGLAPMPCRGCMAVMMNVDTATTGAEHTYDDVRRCWEVVRNQPIVIEGQSSG